MGCLGRESGCGEGLDIQDWHVNPNRLAGTGIQCSNFAM